MSIDHLISYNESGKIIILSTKSRQILRIRFLKIIMPAPPATGSAKSNGVGSGWAATFNDIDGDTYVFSAKVDTPTAAWTVNLITLTYNTKNDLVGNQAYTGYIGQTDVSFTLANGVKMTGKLVPALPQRYNIQGSGNWGVGGDPDGMPKIHPNQLLLTCVLQTSEIVTGECDQNTIRSSWHQSEDSQPSKTYVHAIGY